MGGTAAFLHRITKRRNRYEESKHLDFSVGIFVSYRLPADGFSCTAVGGCYHDDGKRYDDHDCEHGRAVVRLGEKYAENLDKSLMNLSICSEFLSVDIIGFTLSANCGFCER